jgi:hypothetical protein
VYYFAVEEYIMGREIKMDDIEDMKHTVHPQADCNRDEDPLFGLSPCKTSKLAMLHNNLVGTLTMESRV